MLKESKTQIWKSSFLAFKVFWNEGQHLMIMGGAPWILLKGNFLGFCISLFRWSRSYFRRIFQMIFSPPHLLRLLTAGCSTPLLLSVYLCFRFPLQSSLEQRPLQALSLSTCRIATPGKKREENVRSSRLSRDSPVCLPPVENSDLIEDNRLTIIGRVMNPDIQHPKAVVNFMPQLWGMAGKVEGMELGRERFSFQFDSEEELQSVLRETPFHYKCWMLVIQRWELIISYSFPCLIPFWVTIHDLPLHYWKHDILKAICKELRTFKGSCCKGRSYSGWDQCS